MALAPLLVHTIDRRVSTESCLLSLLLLTLAAPSGHQAVTAAPVSNQAPMETDSKTSAPGANQSSHQQHQHQAPQEAASSSEEEPVDRGPSAGAVLGSVFTVSVLAYLAFALAFYYYMTREERDTTDLYDTPRGRALGSAAANRSPNGGKAAGKRIAPSVQAVPRVQERRPPSRGPVLQRRNSSPPPSASASLAPAGVSARVLRSQHHLLMQQGVSGCPPLPSFSPPVPPVVAATASCPASATGSPVRSSRRSRLASPPRSAARPEGR